MLKTLSIKHFRGHNGTFHFGPGLNLIRGPNEGGKTTIAEAIKFLFTGSDILDSPSTEHLITTGHDACEVTLITAKSAVTRKKKRNGTSQIKVAIGDTPAVEIKQQDIDERLIGMSPQLFTACWLSGYFMNSLDEEGRMQLLGSVSNVNRADILLSLLPPDSQIPYKVKCEDPAVDLRVITEDRRSLQNVLSSDEGALREVVASIEATLSGGKEATPDSGVIQQHVNELTAQLELHAGYQRDLSRYENSLRLKEQYDQSVKGAHDRFNAAEQNVLALSAKLSPNSLGDVPILQDYSPEVFRLTGLKKVLPQAPQKPKLPEGDQSGSCPVCLQTITSDHRHAVINEYETTLMAYNKEASEVSQHNLKIQAEIDSLQKKANEEQVAKNEYHRVETQITRELETARKLVADLRKEIMSQKEPTVVFAPAKPEGDQQELSNQLVTKKALLQNLMDRQGKLEGQQERRNLLEQTIQNRKAQIAWLEVVGRALEQLPIVEAEAIAKTLQIDDGRLTIQRFQRKSAGKTLERAEPVITDANGVNYLALSSGRRIRLDSELCYKFQELTDAAGLRAPKLLFVDNKDLVDRQVKLVPGVQVLLCHVDPSVGTGILVDIVE